MDLRAALCSAMFVVSCSSLAGAGPLVDAAQRAEALQSEGKSLEALNELDTAMDAVWVASPLLFRKVMLVDSASGSGEPAERTDRTFRPDETLRLRVEPVGYGYGSGSPAGAKIGFTGDLSVENGTGQVLAEAKNLFSISADSPPRNRLFGMTIGFVVPYVRPGQYVARFTVHDQNSPKSGTFDVPFTVAAPAATPGAESAAPGGSGDNAVQPQANSAGSGAGSSGATQSGDAQGAKPTASGQGGSDTGAQTSP